MAQITLPKGKASLEISCHAFAAEGASFSPTPIFCGHFELLSQTSPMRGRAWMLWLTSEVCRLTLALRIAIGKSKSATNAPICKPRIGPEIVTGIRAQACPFPGKKLPGRGPGSGPGFRSQNRGRIPVLLINLFRGIGIRSPNRDRNPGPKWDRQFDDFCKFQAEFFKIFDHVFPVGQEWNCVVGSIIFARGTRSQAHVCNRSLRQRK